MEQFTIYCTPEQTIKALELGAGIDVEYDNKMVDVLESEGVLEHFKNKNRLALIDGKMYKCPTAEQMIGWLRTKGVLFHFDDAVGHWLFGTNEIFPMIQGYADGKKELAAINAALYYLTNNKK